MTLFADTKKRVEYIKMSSSKDQFPQKKEANALPPDHAKKIRELGPLFVEKLFETIDQNVIKDDKEEDTKED